MKLKFIEPQSLEKNVKATVHKTGKLGFTVEAAKKLKLSNEKSMAIAINEDDPNDLNLYTIVYPTKEKGAFNVAKAGDYYYVNTKPLFDSLKVDYVNDYVAYEIMEDEIDGQNIYVFKRRMPNKKVVNTSNQ